MRATKNVPRDPRYSPCPMRTLLLLSLSALLALASCAAAAPPAAPAPSPAPDEAAVERALDDWHDAAAHADEARYFAHFATSAVFLGTDATERWDVAAFRAYAHPRFATGKAWAFHAVERHVSFGAGGDVAWFDEKLATERLGPARGSGVLVREGGAWKIAEYVLSVPVPNEKFDAVKKAILGV
jgi:hypothetical protein